jgi:hypothetical protein
MSPKARKNVVDAVKNDYPHRGKCPADGKTCSLCKRMNHFAVACRQGQPPNKDQGAVVGGWRSNAGSGYQRSNSGSTGSGSGGHGRFGNNKKVYQVKEESLPPQAGHPDFARFQQYCKWIGSGIIDGASTSEGAEDSSE